MKYKLLFGIFFFAGISMSYAGTDTLVSTTNYTLLGVTAIVLLGALLVLYRALNVLSNTNTEELMKAQGLSYKKSNNGFFDNAVALEDEKDILLDHDYDGIRELDNSLPPWWIVMFYGCIAIGVVYFAYYHVFDMGLSSSEEYALEIKTANSSSSATKGTSITVDNVEVLTDAAILEQGKAFYLGKCKACHAEDGGGGIGPNLTDKYWIHGDGSIKTVFHTISEGVPEKGMTSWKTTMSGKDMQKVASYVLTLQGTTSAKPKEHEGNLIE